MEKNGSFIAYYYNKVILSIKTLDRTFEEGIKRMKAQYFPIKTSIITVALIIFAINILFIFYNYNKFIHNTEELAKSEANIIQKELTKLSLEIESLIKHYNSMIKQKDNTTEIIAKLYRLNNVGTKLENRLNISLNSFYFFSEEKQRLFSRAGEIDNTFYRKINTKTKKDINNFILESIPNNLNFKGIVASKGLLSDTGEYIGSIHLLLHNLFFESLLKEKIKKETKYIITNKNEQIIAASGKDIINAQKDKLEISYGSPFFKFNKYNLAYKKEVFFNEFTLWTGSNFSSLFSSYKNKLLEQVIVLNVSIIILIILYYILLIKGVNLSYSALKAENISLLAKNKKAEDLILNLNSDLDQSKEYINVLKESYKLESSLTKDFIRFEHTKINDALNTSLILEKYLSESNNYINSKFKILDLLKIIKSNIERQKFSNEEYSSKELDLREVANKIIEFHQKTTYEKNIKINISGFEHLEGIYIEKAFLEHVLNSIIANMLKGVGRNNEIEINLERKKRDSKDILEITLADNGFGINIDDIFGVGGSSIEDSRIISTFIPDINACKKTLSNIGGKLINIPSLDNVSKGTKYVLSLPTKKMEAKKVETKTQGNVVYLYE